MSTKRITVRKGAAADFDPTKMRAGEIAINTDDGVVHACYQDGKCHDLVSTDDVASTDTAGIVRLTSSITSDSETTAATPKSVKQAYDLANEAQNAAANAASAASAAQNTADSAQADATKALGKLVTARVQGTTDAYGKIDLPDSTIYPLAALSNSFMITGEYNLRVANVTTDAVVLAKNTAVDFWIVGLKKE